MHRGAGPASGPGEPAVSPAASTRIVVRPIASPLTYGFLGLAVATITEAALDLGFIPTHDQHQVGIVLFAFTFPVQLLSTIYAFIARDTTIVSGLGLQSVSWLTFGLLLFTGAPGVRSEATAVLLLAAGTVILVPAAGASIGKLLPASVIFLTSLRFILTGLWEHFGGPGWKDASGWEGVVLFALALYTALAAELEAVRHQTVLPLGRHGLGRQAVTGPFVDDLGGIEREPGVREQL